MNVAVNHSYNTDQLKCNVKPRYIVNIIVIGCNVKNLITFDAKRQYINKYSLFSLLKSVKGAKTYA